MLLNGAIFAASLAAPPPDAVTTIPVQISPKHYAVPANLAYPDCKISRPRDKDLLVIIGAYDGTRPATVSVAGPDEGTFVADVIIGKGSKPIHLVLSSYDPIIYRFRGNLRRIHRLVVVHNKDVGVVGIPRRKVDFISETLCPIPYGVYKGRSPEWDVPIQAMLGRPANLQGGDARLYTATITDRALIVEKLQPMPPLPTLSEIENNHRQYQGGTDVVAIKQKKLVASGPVERYEVLPGTAGALRLEREGALAPATAEDLRRWTDVAVRLGFSARYSFPTPYRVTRPIRLPPDLCGGGTMSFFVPSLDYIRGDPCHSRIYGDDGTTTDSSLRKQDSDRDSMDLRQLPTSYPKCTLSKALDSDQLVVIGAGDGRSISTVSVAGQNEETHVSDIIIDADSKPLYLVFSSHNYVIYRLRGDVKRVRQVAVVHYNGAGVMGVPRGKVHFVNHEECPVDAHIYEGGTPKRDAEITAIFGRPADLQGGGIRIRQAVVEGRAISVEVKPPLNDQLRSRLERSLDYEGGVTVIDPRQVIASGTVEPYEVLPSAAGTIQLIDSGALVSATADDVRRWKEHAVEGGHFTPEQVADMSFYDIYRVTRPIRLPAGLCGGHMLTLFIASPDYVRGDRCHSEIHVDDGTMVERPAP